MRAVVILGLLFLNTQLFAQENIISKENIENQYICNELIVDTEDKQLELIGDVHFQTDLLTLNHANKIVFYTETNNIVVYGLMEFEFDGEISFTRSDNAKEKFKGIMRYKLGDKIAYVE
jgi:hypothetical protein